MPIEYYIGDPPSSDKMWVTECGSLAHYCEGRGIDVGAGSRTLTPETIRVDCFPDTNPDHVADAMKLPFEDGAYDYVFTSHVLEHMADPRAALREWLRVVRPGGVVACVIPDTRYTGGMNTDRTPHCFEWDPDQFVAQVLGWPASDEVWFLRRGPLDWAPAEVVHLDEAMRGWSFGIVLRKAA